MTTQIEIEDVERGCGHLVPGGYYLSSAGSFASNGRFHAVTYPLGDGLNDIIDCTGIPSRNMMTINVAATFALGQITKQEMIPTTWQGENRDLFDGLKKRVGEVGLIDHVGSNSYSWPNKFADELFEYGPNRHLPPNMVRQVAKYLPVPVVFTHRRVPVFRNQSQIDRLMACCQALLDSFNPAERYFASNWKRPSWGALAHYERGDDHFMIPAIAMLEAWDRQWLRHEPVWQEVGSIAAEIQYVEQPFAMSWFFRAIKIVDDKHPIDAADRKAGIVAAHPVQPKEREQ